MKFDEIFENIDENLLYKNLHEKAGYESDVARHLATYFKNISDKNTMHLDMINKSKIKTPRYKKGMIKCIENRMVAALLKRKNAFYLGCLKSAIMAVSLHKNPGNIGEIRRSISFNIDKELKKKQKKIHRQLSRFRERKEIKKLFEEKYPKLNPKAVDILLLREKLGTTNEDIEVLSEFLEVLTQETVLK